MKNAWKLRKESRLKKVCKVKNECKLRKECKVKNAWKLRKESRLKKVCKLKTGLEADCCPSCENILFPEYSGRGRGGTSFRREGDS